MNNEDKTINQLEDEVIQIKVQMLLTDFAIARLQSPIAETTEKYSRKIVALLREHLV